MKKMTLGLFLKKLKTFGASSPELYIQDEDLILYFIDAFCCVDGRLQTSAADLWDEFRAWFELSISKKVISKKHFGAMMTSAGFSKVKSGGVYCYNGLGLKTKPCSTSDGLRVRVSIGKLKNERDVSEIKGWLEKTLGPPIGFRS